jgi:hypothetical protein
MNDKAKDKEKLQEILNEINNIKRYNNELANNTRGDKLENYIGALARNINILETKTEEVYQDNFNTIN